MVDRGLQDLLKHVTIPQLAFRRKQLGICYMKLETYSAAGKIYLRQQVEDQKEYAI